jgi:hypothetical protein
VLDIIDNKKSGFLLARGVLVWYSGGLYSPFSTIFPLQVGIVCAKARYMPSYKASLSIGQYRGMPFMLDKTI